MVPILSNRNCVPLASTLISPKSTGDAEAWYLWDYPLPCNMATAFIAFITLQYFHTSFYWDFTSMRADKEKAYLPMHFWGLPVIIKKKEAWDRHLDLISVYIGSCYASNLIVKQSELLDKNISMISMAPVDFSKLLIPYEPQFLICWIKMHIILPISSIWYASNDLMDVKVLYIRQIWRTKKEVSEG